MDLFTWLVLPAVVGVGVGVLSGMLGIGGGTVMVPTFRLLFDMTPIASTATSLFAIVPTSISGVVSHLRQRTCIPSLGVACGIGGAFTSPVGVWLAAHSPNWLIMVAAALVIVWSATSMIKKALKLPKDGQAPEKEDAPQPAPADDTPRLTRRQLLMGVGIGAVAGVASGYVGVGGGFIMVPLMLSLVHINMNKASGTSLIAVMILAVPGVVEQAVLGNINYMAGLAIAVGTIPGAVLGAKLVRVVPERRLRFVFGGFLLVAAVLLAVNELGLLG